jgi:hypothetical protein
MWSRHSRRAVLTHRSANACAFGDRIGVLMIFTLKGALTEIRPLSWSLSRHAANSWGGGVLGG